jgi:anti-sigma factor NepR-like protein
MNERKPLDKLAPMEARTLKKKEHASLGREVQTKIGQQLRSYYDGLIEPTPDRFVKLLKQLDQPGDKESSE